MNVILRATYEGVLFPEEDDKCIYSDPFIWRGWCDPENPWGTLDDEPRDQYSVDDEPIELILPPYQAAEFIRDFPGAVWDLHTDCDPSQNYRTGVWTTVTLHVSGEAAETALAIYETLKGTR